MSKAGVKISRPKVTRIGTTLRRGEGMSLARRAYVEIRNRILRGDLPVGMVLSRRQLARELRISVPPVTEALQQLEGERLLESKPRVGTRVRIPSKQDVEDRSQLREALEAQAARLFAERATAKEKQGLRRMGRQIDRLYARCENDAVDREPLFAAHTQHMELHLCIAECARCPALREAIEKEQVLVFSWLFETASNRRSLGSDFHARLTDALATASPARADTAMREHIRFGLAEVLANLERLNHAESGWRGKKVKP